MWIYKIINTKNGKALIGQTVKKKAEYRWMTHKWCLENEVHGNSYFQNAWKKYGKDVWQFEIIEKCESLKELNEKEDYYIEHFDTLAPNGYNLKRGGDNYTLSEYAKEKLSRRLKQAWKKNPNYKCRVYGSIVNPNGKIYEMVINMEQFCREHDLNAKVMRQVATGEKKSYKGWTCSLYKEKYSDSAVKYRIGSAMRGKKHTKSSNIKRSESLKKMFAARDKKLEKLRAKRISSSLKEYYRTKNNGD